MTKSERPREDRSKRSPTSQRPQEAAPSPSSAAAIGGKVRLRIDGQDLQVPLGTTLLEAAAGAGIRIPSLCRHPDLRLAGLCRICVVEVEGMKTLQASCTFPVLQPLTVHTHTRKVRQARRHILDLLLANHYGQCTTCRRNGNCELQALAREYGVDFPRFGRLESPVHSVDASSYSVVRDMNKCILCRRCVRTCIDLQEVGVLEAVHRGAQTTVGTFLEKPMADVICINCGQCINRCPTGALTANDPTDLVWAAIDDPSKHVVIQTAPSPRAAIGECFGLPPGTALTGQMNTALRLCGFDRVFDTNFTADLTVVEEGTELLLRLRDALAGTDRHRPLPQFTSCSPGWVKYLEHFFPHRIPHLSSAKSPQQMLGALVKTHYARKAGVDPASIVTVALMPCTAKKFECNRPEMCASGFKDVDFGLTTREMAGMFKEAGIDLPHLSPSPFDLPFGTATGSGVIFGATGGVMESALRAVLEIVTGERIERFYDHARIMPVRGFEGIRTFEIPVKKTGPVPPLLAHLFEDFRWLEGAVLKVAVCHGTANARRVLEDIEDGGPFSRMHFIEFMACPGGCLGGGGMPIPTTEEIRAARARAIYAEDERSEVRKSHENPAVAEIYREFLVEGPCGATSHRYLHTTYTARGKYIL